jgi:hypothetical protein
VHDAGKAIEKVAGDTGNAIEKGAHDTGNAIEKAFHDISYALTVHPSDAKPNYPPYYIPLQAECPSASYLSKPTKQYAVVGLQFRFAKNLKPKGSRYNRSRSLLHSNIRSEKGVWRT